MARKKSDALSCRREGRGGEADEAKMTSRGGEADEGKMTSLGGGGLCVPQDSLDDLDFFPNFFDDAIPLTDLLLSSPSPPEHGESTIEDVADIEDDDRRPTNAGDGESMAQALIKAHPPLSEDEYESRKPIKTTCMDDGLSVSKRRRKSSPTKKKKAKKKRKTGRKCSHCETAETPQWRRGPMGPNTLCNACGVRYKSGRLLPEYRPFASPTFDSSKHSNFHRKILKSSRKNYTSFS
ncbi:unnamed protein product [Cuscuta europaea]|uniref:GATA-type domain-containing protein n=1 Tax=Cuscuta europaea TaxID=41803 RepID=A0A9P0ZRQ6_CUSEU|nr:unnamed protein product [Cuscuta europaea]